jgi:hypothetical protein
VIVVGMHRSGTSAVTGAIGALGMSLPRADDRIPPSSSNPEHWESQSILLHSDDVLDRLGGSWDAPPDPQPWWVHGPQLVGIPSPAPLFSDAYGDSGPLVWKDPRACLLLPYWRPLIPQPVAAVFVWRSPLAVARSLQNRDGFSLVHGLALWERYNRTALDGMRGMDVFVLGYEALMDDHRSGVAAVAEWLGSLDPFAEHAEKWDMGMAASYVSDEHRHELNGLGNETLLLPEHRSMTKLLSSLDGGHRQLEFGPLPDESEWIKVVLEGRREARLAVKRESDVWERIAEQNRAVSFLETQLANVMSGLEFTQSSLESTEQRLDSTQQRLDSTQQHLDSTLQQLDSTEVELEKITHIVTNMRASTSWRVTKPLRSLSSQVRGGARRR